MSPKFKPYSYIRNKIKKACLNDNKDIRQAASLCLAMGRSKSISECFEIESLNELRENKKKVTSVLSSMKSLIAEALGPFLTETGISDDELFREIYWWIFHS